VYGGSDDAQGTYRESMKAIVVHQLGPPEVLCLEDIAALAPAWRQVLVRVRAAGVNPVDASIRSGIGPTPQLPYTPGTDAGGVVEATGDAVDELSVGQRVYTHGSATGTYADFALCTPEQIAPLPDSLTFAQGAAIGTPYGTAYRALFQRGSARSGERLFVHGASGGVGLAAVQLAVAAGLEVIGSASTVAGRRLILEQGAAHVVDHSLSEHGDEVLELTDGRGVDLILETRSDVHLGADLLLLSRHGRVLCVGNRGPGNEGTVAVNARHLMRGEKTILGVMLHHVDATDLSAIHAALATGLHSGALRPVVTREYPLSQAAVAHRAIATGHTRGKLVLLP